MAIPPPLLFFAAFGLGGLADDFDPWFLASTFAGERWGREERYLERKFGVAYLGYKRRARRWI